MHSRPRPILLSIVCLALILVVSPDLAAQIGLDTSYAGQIARPFDQPIDPDRYLIRPGERLEVVFLNTKLPTLHLTVNTEGRIVHPNLGVLEMSGRTLSQARAILLGLLKTLYNADEIVISIAYIYPVSIQVSGMVNRPGSYTGFTSQRVAEIIDSAGGVAPGGSTRNISLSGGPDILPVDLDRWEFTSDSRYNPYLYSGRHLHVPHRAASVVQVIGEVAAPRSIELMAGEELDDLIELAGGVLPWADEKRAYLLNDSARSTNNIEAQDVIMVPEAARGDQANTLQIYGAIAAPGRYDPGSGLTVADLLTRAGGSLASANRDRIAVFREVEKDALGRRATGRYPLAGAAAQSSLVLRPGDSIYVPVRVGYVTVIGTVERTGQWPFSEGATVGDYLRMAGGSQVFQDRLALEVLDRVSGITRLATARTVVCDGDRITIGETEGDR